MKHTSFIPLLLFFVHTASAQWVTTEDDYDMVAIPVGGTHTPSTGSFDIGEMTFAAINHVPGYDQRYQVNAVGEGRIDVHLHEGDGVQIWSETIPVSATSVYFSCIASVSGEQPQQAAIAIIDAEDSSNIGVSISLNEDIPRTPQEFTMEYECRSKTIHFLIQLLGPETGETVVTLERFRVMSGYNDLDFSLGSTALTFVEHFGNGLDKIEETPSTLPGGFMGISSQENRTHFPQSNDQSLVIGTQSTFDENNVIQVLIPLDAIPLIPDSRTYPSRMVGRAFIKRISGDSGIFSIGLFSSTTGSQGYTDFAVSTIPNDNWLPIESPVVFTEKGAQTPSLIVQIRNGRAKIAVDDVSLHMRRDSPYFWDASIMQPPDPPVNPIVEIPSGTFLRGSKLTTEGGEVPPDYVDWLDEIPQRAITITGFYTDRYEISNQAYFQFWQHPNGGNKTDHTPGQRGDSLESDPFGDPWPTPAAKHPDHPVVSVSWKDAMAYCAWRTQFEKIPSPYRYRLPTEAEWEYMARGTSTPPNKYPWGIKNPSQFQNPPANYEGLEDGSPFTAPVTAYENGASPFGIYNLAGNVWEWCLDWYDPHYYDDSPTQDPMGPSQSPLSYHVIRGGSWNNSPADMRVAHRVSAAERGRNEIGFRCVLSAIQPTYSPTPTRPQEPTNTPIPPPTATPLPPTQTPIPYRPGEVYRSEVLRVDMVYIPRGTFLRGNDPSDDFGFGGADEAPQREITVSAFLIDRFEMNIGLYRMFLQETGIQTPSVLDDPDFSGINKPVVGITYDEAIRFCEWRTEKEGLPKEKAYRLPSEAEWEYAARGSDLVQDRPRIWPWGHTNPSQNDTYANIEGEQDGYRNTSPVNVFPAGASVFNVLNLSGNAAEWCLDWYDPNYYEKASSIDPVNTTASEYRVVRGGSWSSIARDTRCAARDFLAPEKRVSTIGFRCVRKP